MPGKPSEAAFHFEAVKVSWRQDKDGYKLTLAVHPDNTPDELMRSWIGSRYQVAMVEIDDNEQPKSAFSQMDEDVQYAIKLCREFAFQSWVHDQSLFEWPKSESGAKAYMLEHLGIASRKEIPKVREGFKEMVARYLAG